MKELVRSGFIIEIKFPEMKSNEIYPVKAGDWDMTVRVQYTYNTLVLHPAEEYHAGSNGWGDSIYNSRMIQTFFFRENI